MSNAINFDRPITVTPELAREIGCGLPEMLARGGHTRPSDPFVCTGVDHERGVIVFCTAGRRWGRTAAQHAYLKRWISSRLCTGAWPLQPCEQP